MAAAQAPADALDTPPTVASGGRDPVTGRILPGFSGNPAGRPVGSRNRILELQRGMEEAVRAHLKPERLRLIIDKLADMAIGGSVPAAKVLLDKVIPNATPGEEADKDTGRTIVFQIQNATVQALQHNAAPKRSREVVDGEVLNAIEADYTPNHISTTGSSLNGH